MFPKYEKIRRMTDALRGIPLLRSGTIGFAQETPPPQTLSSKLLTDLHTFGYAYIEANPSIIAVAYTQFPPELLSTFDLDPNMRRFVYISHRYRQLDLGEPMLYHSGGDHNLEGALLINPKISPDVRMGRWVMPEKCASIYYGFKRKEPYMFVRRPTRLEVSGYSFGPDKRLRAISGGVGYWFAGYIEHEAHHLDGKAASDHPELLYDPWTPNQKIKEREEAAPYMQAFPAEEVMLVSRDGRLTILNSQGNFVQWYE